MTQDKRWTAVGEPGMVQNLSEETFKKAIKAVLEAKAERWYGVYNENGEFVRIILSDD